MNTQKYLSILKIFPALLGVTSISILTSLPADASQSSLQSVAESSELLLAEAEVTEAASEETAADSSEATEDSAEAATGSPEVETTEDGTEQAESPTASDAPTAAETSSDVPDASVDTAEGGAEPAAEPPTVTPPTVTPPTNVPPTVTPPVLKAPTVTPGGEGGATQPEEAPEATDGAPTGATPAAPSEEVAPTETEQPSSSTPPSTPGAEALQQPEAAGTEEGSQATISESELKQFATAIPQLSTIEKTTKGEITQVIGQSGLSQDKFSALYSSQKSESPAVEATAEEKQSFEQAITKIQSIEQKAQAEQEQIIRAQGLEPQRFGQILAAVRQDQNLKTKVQQMLQTN